MEIWSFNVEKVKEESLLLFMFKEEWFQEDIVTLQEKIMSKMGEVSLIEHVRGADREDIRFNWSGDYFSLRFEYYSQSCWIEPEPGASNSCMNDLCKCY